MAITVKRDDKLTSLFDKFATLPEDKKDGVMAQSIKADQDKQAKADKKSSPADNQ
ncbi:SPJ_0845 family protein [Lapidilactobacillus gannanensis]|uniref:SPJ_0845 family protein n=1 Tax=Lapidilactobacillus gannanensis TaxID=2486002 RepID=A0ABW4BN03_9LACO|nr:SPJ_0845 family protein [Lapidilactobacillus gannanensis]